ncbi:integral membrane protein [Fusarium napiforme]|uniref:Integral membrane protein n=1 Tax=Fusarium napiforme TaxID=42672 RepID=A0A8H5N1F7_9HYPO|nr:integral membrane protein [Fusarium napiforme]
MPIDPSGSTVVATEWALISVATAVILARLYLRLILQRRNLLASDVFMCAAWVSAVALASFDIYFFRIGIFKPGTTFDLAGFEGTAEEAENFYKLYYFSTYPFYTTFYFSKAALLAVYLQIFPSFMVKRRRFLWAPVMSASMEKLDLI